MNKKEKILIIISLILFASFILIGYHYVQINNINFILFLFPLLLFLLLLLLDINYYKKRITWKNWTKKEKKEYYITATPILIIVLIGFIFLSSGYKENIDLLGYTLNYSQLIDMYTCLCLLISSLFQTIYISFIMPYNRRKKSRR